MTMTHPTYTVESGGLLRSADCDSQTLFRTLIGNVKMFLPIPYCIGKVQG